MAGGEPAKTLATRGSSSSTSGPSGQGADVRHFGLTGLSEPLDPRTHAFRDGVADLALAGRVIASHYARALPRACGSRATPIWPEPRAEGEAASELLPGEGFAVLEYTGAWAWGYSTSDHRVGYVEAIELVEPVPATHVVCEASVSVFADGSIGAAKLATMPMGARLTGHESGACLLSEIGCVPMSHVRRVGEYEDDAAGVAMKLLGAPWRAGGRSVGGVDAAGLIQLAFGQCGVSVPRDLDMQAGVGELLAEGAPLKRGDLVIAGDEGGLMIDDLMLVHASREAGKVTVEPVAVVEARHEGGVRVRVG